VALQVSYELFWISDEAHQQRKVAALVLRHIVDVYGARLKEDGAEEIRPRYESAKVARSDLHSLRAMKGLRTARHFYRARG
jgi:hypothetical protein